jgi:hypothetical protein
VSGVQKHGRVCVQVDATVDQVWRVIRDVTRTGEWSHECREAWWADDDVPRVGARFQGRNRAGWARWTRTGEVVALDPPRTLAWRTVPTLLFPDSTEWRLELAPLGAGATVTQSFDVLRAPTVLDRVYALLVPSHQDRDARLREDLARLGSVAGCEVRA